MDRRASLILGARNLGKAIVDLLVSEGWGVAGGARSESTLAGVRSAGALALEADGTDYASVRSALEATGREYGRVDLVVNAASAYGGKRTGPFGGGPLAEADPEAFDSWAGAPPRAAFTFLSEAGRFLRAQGSGGTIVQVTGGSA